MINKNDFDKIHSKGDRKEFFECMVKVFTELLIPEIKNDRELIKSFVEYIVKHDSFDWEGLLKKWKSKKEFKMSEIHSFVEKKLNEIKKTNEDEEVIINQFLECESFYYEIRFIGRCIKGSRSRVNTITPKDLPPPIYVKKVLEHFVKYENVYLRTLTAYISKEKGKKYLASYTKLIRSIMNFLRIFGIRSILFQKLQGHQTTIKKSAIVVQK